MFIHPCSLTLSEFLENIGWIVLNSGSKRHWLPEEGVIRFVLKVQNKLNLLPWIKEGVRNILADPRRAVFSRILRLYLDSMGSLLILYQVCPGRKRGSKDARGSHSGIKCGCLCHRVLSSGWTDSRRGRAYGQRAQL